MHYHNFEFHGVDLRRKLGSYPTKTHGYHYTIKVINALLKIISPSDRRVLFSRIYSDSSIVQPVIRLATAVSGC